MGTRSTISIMNADNTVTSIYCHWDGYISHHGPILLNHYNTEAKVRALLELRSLSTLGEVIGEKHEFDFDATFKRADGEPRPCTSHFRDRGDDIPIWTGALADVDSQEYNYLFRNGKWEVSEGDMNGWAPLVPEVVADKLAS